MKSNILKYGVIGFVLTLCVCIVAANMSTAKLQPKSNNIEVNSVSLKEDGNRLSFDLQYPEVKYQDEQVQTKINNTLKEQMNEFKKYIQDMYNEAVASTPKDVIENSVSFMYSGTSTFEYEVVGNILSIRLNLVQFTGGAHPMSFVRDFNFDLSNGNVIKFKDLFNEEGKKIFKDRVDNIIRETMCKNPDEYFIEEFKGIGDDVQYYLTKDNIVVFYQLYELAPYSAGIPEFKIPYSAFEGLLNTNIKK